MENNISIALTITGCVKICHDSIGMSFCPIGRWYKDAEGYYAELKGERDSFHSETLEGLRTLIYDHVKNKY